MIHFVASDVQGGGRIRSFWPAERLKASGHDATASVFYPDFAEVVVIHRPIGRDTLDRVKAYKAEGSTVFIDEDDDLNAIPFWQSFWPPREELLPAHDEAISEADGLVVTTKTLGDVYGPLAKKTHIIPNRLPGWVSKVKVPRKDNEVRVGWQGITFTHGRDLKWLQPVAEEMVRGATFETIGDPRALRLLQVQGRWWPFETTGEDLYRRMSRVDIGIVPLVDDALNRSKSALKALEYGTLGKPVVVRDLPEQRQVVIHEETGFLVDTPEEFRDAVLLLIHDQDLRAKMGTRAKQVCSELSLELHDEWQQIAS